MPTSDPHPDMTTALFPGSFDPFTIGHLDILRRARAIFPRVVVSIGINTAKTSAADAESRIEAIRRATAAMDGVEVMTWEGLTVDAARAVGATVIVRGIRSSADFEYERPIAELNRRISGIDTLFLPADPALAAISSSAVRELQRFGYDTKEFLP